MTRDFTNSECVRELAKMSAIIVAITDPQGETQPPRDCNEIERIIKTNFDDELSVFRSRCKRHARFISYIGDVGVRSCEST